MHHSVCWASPSGTPPTNTPCGTGFLMGVAPTRTPWTEPSAMANWTTPLCRLENTHQAPLTTLTDLPSYGPPGPRPHLVHSEPLPIQLYTKSRGDGLARPPSSSPASSVFEAPSAVVISATVTFERL